MKTGIIAAIAALTAFHSPALGQEYRYQPWHIGNGPTSTKVECKWVSWLPPRRECKTVYTYEQPVRSTKPPEAGRVLPSLTKSQCLKRRETNKKYSWHYDMCYKAR